MKKKSNNKKPGRPKGTKSKSGIPSKSLQEMIEMVKKAYDNVGTRLMSVDDITNYLGLQKGSNYPILGMLSEAGLVEKEGIGYKVTELAKRAINGDKNAIKIIFERNPIFSDLSNHYSDQEITPGLIVAYLKQKYKKGENVDLIAQRFLEGINYINASGIGKIQHIIDNSKSIKKDKPESVDSSLIRVIKLKYALNPPDKSELNDLKSSVCNELKRDSNEVVKVMASNLEKNKDNDVVFNALFDSLWEIFLNDYPELKDKQEIKPKDKFSKKSDIHSEDKKNDDEMG